MSTQTISAPVPAAAPIAVNSSPGIPFARLFHVELRKQTDTRASLALLAILGALLALGIAALGTALAGALGSDVTWSFAPSVLGGLLVTLVLLVAQGIAFGLLIQNTPGAIVAYFVLPTIMTMLSSLVGWIGKYADWIDLTFATAGVSNGEFNSATISRAAVASLLWIVLPGVLGLIRMWRREVK